jgi:tRNA 2-selenouridine synthase
MPSSFASVGSLVHPHQLEIQDFSLYALIVDARHPAAYAQDHIPGAVNVPAALVASGPAPPMPSELAAHVRALARDDMVLVYCDRGGLDSEVWARPLRAAGFAVDVLGGGWGNYRRWVAAGLELLPRALSFRHLVAPPVSGLCRILGVLARQGQPVLDISELAGQRLVPGLTLPGDAPPSQEAFETLLLDGLRKFDPDLPVWVRVGPAPLTTLTLPPALRDTLARADEVVLQVPLAERARAWLERLQAMRTPLPSLIAAFSASALPPPSGLAKQWGSLDAAGQTLEALSGIIKAYIDPNNEVVRSGPHTRLMTLGSLDTDAVVAAMTDWLRALPAAQPRGG